MHKEPSRQNCSLAGITLPGGLGETGLGHGQKLHPQCHFKAHLEKYPAWTHIFAFNLPLRHSVSLPLLAFISKKVPNARGNSVCFWAGFAC